MLCYCHVLNGKTVNHSLDFRSLYLYSGLIKIRSLERAKERKSKYKKYNLQWHFIGKRSSDGIRWKIYNISDTKLQHTVFPQCDRFAITLSFSLWTRFLKNIISKWPEHYTWTFTVTEKFVYNQTIDFRCWYVEKV